MVPSNVNFFLRERGCRNMLLKRLRFQSERLQNSNDGSKNCWKQLSTSCKFYLGSNPMRHGINIHLVLIQLLRRKMQTSNMCFWQEQGPFTTDICNYCKQQYIRLINIFINNNEDPSIPKQTILKRRLFCRSHNTNSRAFFLTKATNICYIFKFNACLLLMLLS